MTDTTTSSTSSATIKVNVDNYVRAETSFQIQKILALAGDLNTWKHNYLPTPLDRQNVIRMNRDTLYSFAVVDIREGCTVTVPDSASRYMTVMVVNEDHYINHDVLVSSGKHVLTMENCGGTPYVVLIARTLADSTRPDDIKQANELQDQLQIEASSKIPYQAPNYDKESYDTTYHLLLELSKGVSGTDRMFGPKEKVSEVRHLLGTAYGWGGLPADQAYYITLNEPRAAGDFELTVDKAFPWMDSGPLVSTTKMATLKRTPTVLTTSTT